MRSRLNAMLIGLSSLAIATSAAAHESHYRTSSGLSGSITISTGAPYYPGGVYGTLHFGEVYPIVPAYYPQGMYYRNCGHWHAPRYYGYNRVGYYDGYWNYHGKHLGKRNKHHRSHNRGYDHRH